MGSESSKPVRHPYEGGLNSASVQPISQAEAVLLTPTGKSCTFRDTGELAFRLQQLQLINHAIQTLSRELSRDPSSIDFTRLHQDAMSYKDADGKPVSGYSWRMLAEDVSAFPALESSINRFKEFEQYIMKKIGAPPSEMKKDMDFFMVIFIRLRDKLLDIMAESCQM